MNIGLYTKLDRVAASLSLRQSWRHRIHGLFVPALLLGSLSLLVGPAFAACPPFHSLSNGTTADATQVMDNFNYILQCPNFTGSVGINTTPYPLATLQVKTGTDQNFAIQGPILSDGLTLASFNDAVTLWKGMTLSASQFYFHNGSVGIGTPTLASTAKLQVKTGTDQNFSVQGPTGLSDGISLASFNDAVNQAKGMTFGASQFYFYNGNVGIGTATPAATAKLQVKTGTDQNFAVLGAVGLSDGISISSYNDAVNARKGMSFYASRFYFTDGNVGINTTNPGQALEVNGQVQVDTLASAASTNLCITATSNGVIASCSSSIRYKQNVKDAQFCLREILAMRPVTFKWKGRNEQDFGLIAEEMAKINPRFVTYKSGKIEGVKYPQLTAVLANAVKELKAANDGQATQIAWLGKQNTVLLGRIKQQATEAQGFRARLDALERKTVIHTAENLRAAVH